MGNINSHKAITI